MSRLSESIDDLKQNERQWEAFTTEGHCVVLAPPGSGKTKLLTTRMAHDLATKIRRPQGAACITLTNAAADQLRRRVGLLGVEDRPSLFIGTVHSFLLGKVLAPFAYAIGRPELASITIVSEEEGDKLLSQAVAEAIPWGDTTNVASTISFNRRRLASVEEWAKSGEGVREAARLYEAKLQERGLHDFDGVVATAVELVEDHLLVRQVLTAQYPHLYVDEYQDLSPGLDRVVKALCFDYFNGAELFAVGDPDQALFGFTGTRPELLAELADRPDVTSVELTRNYRSRDEILKVANRMRDGRSPMVGHQPGGRVSVLKCPEGRPGQYARVAAAVRQANADGVPLHEIAVLCPTGPMCQEAVSSLRQNGIPAFYRNKKAEYYPNSVTTFVEAAATWAAVGRETSGFRLGDLLRRWRYLLGPLWTHQRDRSLVTLLVEWGDRRDDQAVTFYEELLATGLAEALDRVALAGEVSESTRMEMLMRRWSLSVEDFARRTLSQDRVEVITTTSSKGLEFDVVLLVGADDNLMPSYLCKTTEAFDEDRRKFYVSITRARTDLQIFYSGFATARSGRSWEVGVSRYVREVGLA